MSNMHIGPEPREGYLWGVSQGDTFIALDDVETAEAMASLIDGRKRWVQRSPEIGPGTEQFPGWTEVTYFLPAEPGATPSTLLVTGENGDDLYYVGPLDAGLRLFAEEEGPVSAKWENGRWLVQDGGNHWGAGPTQEQALRYLLAAAFGPVDDEYDEAGLQHRLEQHGATPSTDELIFPRPVKTSEQLQGEESAEPMSTQWCDWYDEPNSRRPWWAKEDCCGDTHDLPQGRLCQTHRDTWDRVNNRG